MSIALHARVHVPSHTWALVAVAVLACSLGLALGAIIATVHSTHRADNVLCREVNELRRQLVVTGADLGWPPEVRDRLLPSATCSDLP